MSDVTRWVDALALVPHPEGGFYRETYRDARLVEARGLAGPRSASTAIYFLLRRGDVSRLHRIRADEVWHHYAGACLTVHVLHEDGRHEAIRLGKDLDAGERPQAVVPAGAWFGARIEDGGDAVLVGCTVAPGFEFADLEFGDRDSLVAAFPQAADVVRGLLPEQAG